MDLEALRTGPLADVSDPAAVVSSTVAFHGRVWDIRTETARFADGEITRDYVSHTGAVAVLAIDDNDRVLLINQYRHPIRERIWELPAGLLDVDGEPPLEAAKRELAEETDLAAREWTPLVTFTTSPGGSNEVVHLFEARGLSAAPTAHERTEEESEIVVRWVDLDDVVAAIFDGRLHNGPVMIGALAARARRE